VIHHLLTEAQWAQADGGPLHPESLRTEGFVHCSPDEATLLAVANRFYRAVDEPFLVLDLDEERVGHPVRWEPPAHPDGRPAAPGEPWFPHLYGPVEPGAVRAVRRMLRSPDGTFVAIDAPT